MLIMKFCSWNIFQRENQWEIRIKEKQHWNIFRLFIYLKEFSFQKWQRSSIFFLFYDQTSHGSGSHILMQVRYGGTEHSHFEQWSSLCRMSPRLSVSLPNLQVFFSLADARDSMTSFSDAIKSEIIRLIIKRNIKSKGGFLFLFSDLRHL